MWERGCRLLQHFDFVCLVFFFAGNLCNAVWKMLWTLNQVLFCLFYLQEVIQEGKKSYKTKQQIWASVCTPLCVLVPLPGQWLSGGVSVTGEHAAFSCIHTRVFAHPALPGLTALGREGSSGCWNCRDPAHPPASVKLHKASPKREFKTLSNWQPPFK